MTLQVGTRLAHYEIVESIGKGGMGEVYRALDGKLGRDVAIKVLPDEFARDKERLERFEREARLLAQLNHANIATLYGLEEHGGQKFLVMELVEGETLAERIARGSIPIDEALPLFIQIAEGIEAAHEKGIIHRDLKPANIKVTPKGKPKVLDFGLAKAFAKEPSARDLSQSPTMTKEGTRAGLILGTARYMSPEQARAKPVGKPADIWAFGCCLYEALTGKAAFPGESVSDTIAAVLKNDPDWQPLPASTHLVLRILLRRCLEKDSTRRVHDIADARIQIEEALEGPSESFPTAAVAGAALERRASRLTTIAVVAIIAAMIAIGVALWSLMGSGDAAPKTVTRFAIPIAPDAELALGTRPAVAISPDGRHVAYVARWTESTKLYLRALNRMEAKPLAGTEGARMPFFSPDGQWLGFHAAGKLMRISLTGGAPLTMAEVVDPRGASWGPDGTIVFSSTAVGGLSRASVEGGMPEVLTTPDRGRREKTHRFPEVLPGGKAVLFTLGTGDIEFWDDASIAVLSLETGEYRVVLEGGSYARYSASGHLVYARAGALLAVPFDLAELRVEGVPVPAVPGVVTERTYGPAEFAISRTGSLLYAPGDSRGGERQVLWVDRQGRSQTLIETPRPFDRPRLSHDGRLLALGINGANTNLWVYEFARGSLTRLASGFDNWVPVWSPDGRRVAFTSTRDGPSNLFSQAADGSGSAERLTTSAYSQYPSSWSPDGKRLAFYELRPGADDIWVLSMEGDRTPQPFLQTMSNERIAVFSPNGQWIAYESDESGQYEIYVRPFPGSGAKQQVSIAGGTEPRWNPDGKELFYRDGDQMMVVDVERDEELALGKPRLLFSFRSPSGAGYDVAPDGQRFVMLSDAESRTQPNALIVVLNWFDELERLVPTEN